MSTAHANPVPTPTPGPSSSSQQAPQQSSHHQSQTSHSQQNHTETNQHKYVDKEPIILRYERGSNSTSTVNVTSTIVEPNMGELVSSVSTMLHCQMMRDIDADEKKKKMLPYFCEENYTGKIVKEIPAVKYIYQFLKQVFEVGQFNPECCVISLVYINRLIGVTGVPLTQSNWKPVSVSALVLAQKVWDDTPLINADFSILYPALTVKEINFLERKFLDLLEFKLTVSSSLYAQYYFELRSICEENAQTFSTKPLSKAQARRLELRSNLTELYQREKHHYKKRSMTVEDIHFKTARMIIS